ncbi:MAG: sugar ABC transporter substrate-binding protein [Clostridiales Family XIII bacterium]|jgi:ABC-type sugar transport system substrate-binding protein|nr:sugar ABC transporter substrate-binding protein [Clostridiales Family XIII bacterium]
MSKSKIRKLLAMAICIAMVLVFAVGCGGGGSSTAAEPAGSSAAEVTADGDAPAGEVQTKSIGFYADAADSYYAIMNDALNALAEQDPLCDWTINYQVGSSTADEQLKAVEDFINSGYDAIIVIQNNPGTTSECIAKCVEADIPYFGASHYFGDEPNAADATGSIVFDFKEGGHIAGVAAIENDVKNVIMIEGVLGQGSASDQTLGFLTAYEEAGKSFGEKADGTPWTAEEIAINKPPMSDIKGDYDIAVVYWASGNWMAEPAQKAMTDAITSLGADGWDGAYVQNNPMVEGAINAMTSAGLDAKDYYISSMNGREVSWEWAKEGTIKCDVNQSSCLEGAVLYQQLKEYFETGTVSKPFVRPYLTGYTDKTITELEPVLIPFQDLDAFIEKVNNDEIVWKLDDPKFVEIEKGYGK